MTAPVLVSAYPVSPAFAQWDPDLEAELLPAICALDGVAGLELPWLGRLHKFDDAWLLENLPAVPVAITPIPFVMGRLAADPSYGIASPSSEGRRAALDDLRRVAADAARIDDESAARVELVFLHSAPREIADPDALARSLDEVAGWDWRGAKLAIEHCDAFVPGQAPEKGFLTLGQEIDAISRTYADVGIWLNWGRLAIELRDADAVTAQIERAAASGLLTGVALSGAAATESPYGYPWIDAHLPIASADPESRSELDDAHVRAAIAAAGSAPWLGLKVARLPTDRTAADALATVRRNLGVVTGD